MKLNIQVMPILFRRKRRGRYVALARPSEYASIRAMRILALFLFGYLAFFVGPLPPAIAQDMNAIQRLYQQNLVGNILPPLVSAPPRRLQRRRPAPRRSRRRRGPAAPGRRRLSCDRNRRRRSPAQIPPRTPIRYRSRPSPKKRSRSIEAPHREACRLALRS